MKYRNYTHCTIIKKNIEYFAELHTQTANYGLQSEYFTWYGYNNVANSGEK